MPTTRSDKVRPALASFDDAKAMALLRDPSGLKRYLHPKLDLAVAVLPDGSRSIRWRTIHL